jgi:hypothetical protein
MVLVIVVIFYADSVAGGVGGCGACDRLPSHDPHTTGSAH